jgi:c-di-AMP phosphodiesterase-like protein
MDNLKIFAESLLVKTLINKFNFYYLLKILLFIIFLLFFIKFFTRNNKKNSGTFINCLSDILDSFVENLFDQDPL